jgi:transcriptional regulator with XRE-family HTH domain
MELRELTVRLKQIRERQGLSLTDLSERSGMTRAAISKLENEWNLNPTLDTLFRYATALGAHVRLSIEGPPPPRSEED